ncbi:Cytochrome P450 [Corchorus olitorius]|uniref:Cytochrome P450 n=1 Tax=Corchorus olitorius TaxID=93759 RepID=A0A1R3HXD3_9ROSI|nr:Cytochrome P450 [Corchorus olitorius]
MADKYGPIFTIKLGVSRAIIVSSWELAKECLLTNDKIFATRPKSVAYEHLTYNYAMFGFSPYGPYWRLARKLATVQLLSDGRLATFRNLRQREVKAWMKEIHERWGKKDSSSNKVTLEMKSLLGELSLNLIYSMIVGKRYVEYAAWREDGKQNDSNSWRKTMREFDEFTGGFLISDMIPYLKWLDIGGQEREMKKTGKALNDMAEEWLEEHKRKREYCGEGIDQEKDFMDVLLSILQVEEMPGFDSDTVNKALCVNLILAAHETSSVAMIWVIALLVNHQDILKKAQHELDIQIAPFDEPIDMNGRPGITNLKASPLKVLLSPRLPAYLYE